MKKKGSIKKAIRTAAVITIVFCAFAALSFGVADAVAYSRKVVNDERWDYTFWLYEGEKDDAGGIGQTGEAVEIVEKFDASKAKNVKPGTNFQKVIDLRSNASYESYGYVMLEIGTVSAMKAEDMKAKVYDCAQPAINTAHWELVYQKVSSALESDSVYIYRYKSPLKPGESTVSANDSKSLCTLVKVPAFTEVTDEERTIRVKGYLIQTTGFETGTLSRPGSADTEAIRKLTE